MTLYDKLNNPIALTIFLFTLLLPIAVGFIAMRRTKNESDFFVGGKAMDKFVVALSAVSSGRSSWLVLGVSGMAYSLGVGAIWAFVGYIIVEMFQFVTIGQRLRMQTDSMEAITLLDYFENRFKDNTQIIRWTGSVILIIFLTAYVAAQLNAGGKALSTALDIPILISLIISAVFILIYIILGGFIAVAYNDVIRAIIMIIGLVIFPVVGLIKLGGFPALMQILNALDPKYIDPFSIGAGAMIGFLGIGLGSPGQPHIVVRYMSIDDPAKLKFSAIIGTFWNIVLAFGALCIGLLGRAIIPNVDNLPDANAEMVYLVLASDFFGPVLYGLIIGGIFAAILSTADSQLLVIASTITRDIYEKIIKKGQFISEKNKLKISRIVVLISGIISIILAYIAKDIIFWLVLFAWGGLGAAFGTSLIMALYWKKTTKWGIVAGMLTGTCVTIIWKQFLKASTGVYELIPAFGSALLMIVVVSLMTRKKIA